MQSSVAEVDYIAAMSGGIYSSYEKVPVDYRDVIENGRRGTGAPDYRGALERGKEWVIAPLAQLQQQSYNALKNCAGPLLLGVMLIDDLMHPEKPKLIRPILFINVAGRMVEVLPAYPGATYEDGDDCFGSLLALPEALSKSWLWRTEGWRVPSKVLEGPMVNRRLIGHPSSNWSDADNYLDSLGKGWKKKYLPQIVEMFPDIVVEPKNRYSIRRYKFRCFLDTRPSDVAGPVGDQFFVCATRKDGVVYHIHNGDVENIRVLKNSAEAIDSYCAHTLLRKSEAFDFSRWS